MYLARRFAAAILVAAGATACDSEPGPDGLAPPVPIVDAAADASDGSSTPRAVYTGQVAVPLPAASTRPELTVRVGSEETTLSSDNVFALPMKMEGVSAISVELPDGTPVLLSLFPKDPELAGENPVVNAESTALSLLFLQPSLLVTDPIAMAVLQASAAEMPETKQLAALLERELTKNPYALASLVPELKQATTAMVAAFTAKVSNSGKSEAALEPDVEKALLQHDGFLQTSGQDGLKMVPNLDLAQGTATIDVYNPVPRWVLAFRDEGVDSDSLDQLVGIIPSSKASIKTTVDIGGDFLATGFEALMALFKRDSQYRVFEALRDRLLDSAGEGKAQIRLEDVTVDTRLRTYALGYDATRVTMRGTAAIMATLLFDYASPLMALTESDSELEYFTGTVDFLVQRRPILEACVGRADLQTISTYLSTIEDVARGKKLLDIAVGTALRRLDLECITELLPKRMSAFLKSPRIGKFLQLLALADVGVGILNAGTAIARTTTAWQTNRSTGEYEFLFSKGACSARPDACYEGCGEPCPSGEVCDRETQTCVTAPPISFPAVGPPCSDGSSGCSTDAPPIFNPPAAIASSLPYLQQANFQGVLQDTVGLQSLEMRVSGPRGSNQAFFENLAGKSVNLNSYFFDSKRDYAGVAGTYQLELRATNTRGKVASSRLSIEVTCNGTGISPVIQAVATPAEVGLPVRVDVKVGGSSSPTSLQVQCTSPGSQFGGGSPAATFINGPGTAGRIVSPEFSWSAAGLQTIYCSTFDPDGGGECKTSQSVSVAPAAPPVGDIEGPQGFVSQPNASVQAGMVVNVGWHADDLISGLAEVYIDYTTDGGVSWVPAAGGANLAASLEPDTSGDDYFPWSVPDVATTLAAFRMRLRDNIGNTREVRGTTFEIRGTCSTPAAPYLTDPGVSAPLGAYDVTWLSVVGATGYELEESTASTFLAASALSLAGTTHHVSGQTNGTWHYRVRGVNACGPGSWSQVQSIDVQVNQPPFAPSSPVPTSGAPSVPLRPTLQWSGGDAEGATEYAVWFGTDPSDLWVPQPFGPSRQVVFTSSLAAATTYYWQVRARDAEGALTTGPLWSFTTAASYADLVAKTLNVAGSVIPGGTVTLSLEVENQGTEDALPCFADIFLGDVPGATDVRLFGSRMDIPALPAGASTSVSKAVALEGLQPGTSYLVARIDSTDGSIESSLANNLVDRSISYADTTAPTIETVEFLWGAGPDHDEFQTQHPYRVVSHIVDDVEAGCDTLDLHYSSDGGSSWQTVAEHVACSAESTQTYEWTIPPGAQLTSQGVIRVTARDASGNESLGFTDPFEIIDGSGPAVALTSPNGGENWKLGESVNVSWTASDATGIAATRVYLHRGTQVDQLVYAQGNPGQYTWSVPANASFVSDDARIRVVVQDAQGNEATAFSNAPFGIIDASAPPDRPWDVPRTITSTPTCTAMGCSYGSQMPVLAVDSSGDAHLVYLYRQDHTDSLGVSYLTQRLYYVKLHAGAWSGAEVIADLGTQSSNPYLVQAIDLAVDSSGRPHVAWESGGTGSSNWYLGDIYVASRNGGVWSTPTNISSNASQSRAPRVVVSSLDDVYVFWRDGRTRDPVAGTWSGTVTAYYRSRPAGSSSWGALASLGGNPELGTFDARRGAGGHPQLTYIGADGSLSNTVWTGNAWTAPRGFGQCSPVSSSGGAPSMSATSSIVDAVFIDSDAGSRLKHAFFDGLQVQACVDVSGSTVGQTVINARVRHDTSGLPTTVWIEDGSAPRVMARRMLARPAQWSTPGMVSLATQVPIDGHLAYGVGTNGMAYVAWTGYANGRMEVFYNFADLTMDIEAPAVQLTSPSLNEVIQPGSDYELVWLASDLVGVSSVQGQVSFDDGTTWQAITPTLPGTAANAIWSVPAAAEGSVLVQVVALDAAGNVGVALGSAFISDGVASGSPN